MIAPYFFGYGSLVNRATHSYHDAHVARLHGWRRVWRHTTLRPIPFLTAIPDPHTSIDGLIAHVPGNDWRALDKRESAYDRVSVSASVSHPKQDNLDIATYTVPYGKHGHANQEHPLLLSYIDVVAQGYLNEFGEDGLAAFFQTTTGWSAAVLNDRDAPMYPRHQSLSPNELRLVDAHLSAVGAHCQGHTPSD